MAMHVTKCRDRPDVQALAKLNALEGPKPLEALKDWKPCPNCGEAYGEFAFAPHLRRCRKILPHGRVKDGVQWGPGPPPAPNPLEQALHSLGSVFGAAADDHGSGLSGAELDRLRRLFDRHDTDGDGELDERELSTLLVECFPTRASNVEHMMAEFRVADSDGNGSVSFGEFVRYHSAMTDGDAASRLSPDELERLRRLFSRFDANGDGALDGAELETLLIQCFPERAADSQRLAAECRAADLHSVDFAEFLRYHAMLLESGAAFSPIAAMFHFFDADGSGALDPNEFLCLLNSAHSRLSKSLRPP